MKIEITKEHYKDLLIMSGIANGVLGILGDALSDTSYKEHSNRLEKLEEHLLKFAADFDCAEWTEKFEGKTIFNEKMYEKHILSIMQEYDEYERFDGLANELAWRDFKRDHTKDEIKKIAEKNGGYFGVELQDYEEKYWDEFEKHGFDRLEIKKGTLE